MIDSTFTGDRDRQGRKHCETDTVAGTIRGGKHRVVWRYDPIIISNKTPVDYHLDKFTILADSLRYSTKRVMVSLVDYYPKTNRRLSELEEKGDWFDRSFSDTSQSLQLLSEMAKIAMHHGIEIFSCAEDNDFSEAGVCPGSCIDRDLINQTWSINLTTSKDAYQRPSCPCIAGKDIGVNDTCIHGCLYCYSTRNINVATRRHSEHDPKSPVLWGNSRPLSESEHSNLMKTRLL